MSAREIGRMLAEDGLTIHYETILRHKQHFQPEPTRPRFAKKHDFAVKVRDRMSDAIDAMKPIVDEETGEITGDPILLKDFAPAIGAGLKAQAIIDKREQAAKKQTGADLLIGLLRALRGEGQPVALLNDGLTVEGTAVEID